VIRDTRDKTDFPRTAAACPPWPMAPRSGLTPLFEAASDTQRRERPGPSGHLVPAEGQLWAARRRSTHIAPAASDSAGPTSGIPPLGRSAVTALTSSGRLDPEHGERVDGDPAAQFHAICGPGAARLADLHASSAVSPPHPASASRTTTSASHSATPAPIPAFAPGHSPQPSRLTPCAPATATPGICREGGDRSAAPTTGAGGVTVDLSSNTDLHLAITAPYHTNAGALTTDLRTNDEQDLRMNGFDPEGLSRGMRIPHFGERKFPTTPNRR